MADSTLTYDDKVKGWTSFYSYIPDLMTNMNNKFYSFKDGQLYLHNIDSENRNNFYGVTHNTEIELLLNEGPSDVKIFKTIEIEGDSKEWDVTVVTDLEAGHINKVDFENKEGFKYAYIRRDAEDEVNTDLLSVQGVGNLVGSASNVYTFGTVPSNVSIGDVLYSSSGGAYTKVGTITAKTSTTITLSSSLSSPSNGSFMFVAKNTVAESYGLKGYYASVTITNNGTKPVEVFAVNSEAAKSFP